ncbi:peptidoglycan bridge formation glycyltransferase FemA/FemB family protein [Ancylomarina sp. DW003]|nr:peptidoglycan bridge formation glycyltransferase FemA/FemB family protein [Ancylomarina sp. DW003]MDE5421913.1 peptidoglycan bridge formation glycyltransferase FemA/FemB family protein [Ancylomarina sp. DW003]
MEIKYIQYKWCEKHSIFASEQYLKSISDNYGWIGAYDNSQELICVYPFIRKRFGFINYIYTPSELIVLSEKFECDLFFKELISFLKKDRISFILQQPPQAVSSYRPSGSENVKFGTYKIDLLQSEEDLWGKLHSKHRNVIRNAEKKGIEVKIVNGEYQTLYSLLASTMQRSNMTFLSREQFGTYMDNMKGKQISFIAYKDGMPQGCAILPYSKESAYYSYGGSISKPITGAMNYLHWKAILHFKSIGVCYYDFVGARVNPKPGSKLEGIQRFKVRFGGDFHLGCLWRFPINRFHYRIYRFLLMIKKRQFKEFKADIIDQEKSN